jgi:hypothetical protein
VNGLSRRTRLTGFFAAIAMLISGVTYALIENNKIPPAAAATNADVSTPAPGTRPSNVPSGQNSIPRQPVVHSRTHGS